MLKSPPDSFHFLQGPLNPYFYLENTTNFTLKIETPSCFPLVSLHSGDLFTSLPHYTAGSFTPALITPSRYIWVFLGMMGWEKM